MSENDVCYYDGFEYSEGSLICVNGRELKCRSGQWQETGYSCEGLVGDDARGEDFNIEAFPLSFDDQSSLFVGEPAPSDIGRNPGLFVSENVSCFQFINSGTNHSVILAKKPNCGTDLQTCTIKWINGATDITFLEYRLSGAKKREISQRATIGDLHSATSGWDATDGPDVTGNLSHSTQHVNDGTPGGLVAHRIRNTSRYYVCVTLRLTRRYDSGFEYTKDLIYMHPPRKTGTVETHSPGVDHLTVTILSGHADPE